jgi:hypothetical protein
VTPTPLTVSEARAILIADEAMDLSLHERVDRGLVMDSQERDAWINLVESARQRVAAWDRRSP